MRNGWNKRVVFVLVVLVAALLAGCIGGKSYRLTVQVMGVGDQVLEGASVVVGSVTEETDSEGKAVFEKVSGQVTIEVTAADYLPTSKTVTVAQDQTEIIVLGQDTADVEELMAAFRGEGFNLSEDEPDEDVFFEQLEAALGYFAESVLVSYEEDFFVDEVEIDTQDFGYAMFQSKILPKEILLDYDEETSLEEYFDYLRDTMGEDRSSLLRLVLMSVDFIWGEMLDGVIDELAHQLEDDDAGIITSTAFGDVEADSPVVIIEGDTATWTEVYRASSTIITVDEQILTGEYSVTVQFGLVKDAKWMISEIYVQAEQHEMLPMGLRSFLF